MKQLKSTNKSISDKIGFSKYSIHCDKFDIEYFENIKNKNTTIRETGEEGSKNYDQFPELHQDLFSSLYRYAPELRNEREVKKESLLNREIIQSVMDSDKYKSLRNLTRLDKVNSTVGTEVMGSEVSELLKKLKKQKEKLQEVVEADQAVVKAKKNAAGENDDSGKDSGNQEYTLKEAQARLSKAMKELKKSTQKREVRAAISNIMDEAIETTKDTTQTISDWGLDSDNTFSKMPYHEKMKLLKKLKNSKKLHQIAKLAGRLKHIAAKREKEKVRKGFDEIYDITRGRDLSKVIPAELTKLQDPCTRKVFLKNFAEGSLLQYEIQGKEKKGKGALVVCIDSSGSMSGDSETWAKAVALALLDIAILQKRNYFAIHFESEYDKTRLHTNEFLKNTPYDINEVIDLAEYFCGGGTLFHPALELAQDKINLEKDFSKADIIFITDGESTVTEEFATQFLQWKKEKNVKVHSVLINSYRNSTTSLKLFSDNITKLNSLIQKGETTAIRLFDAL